MKQPGVLGFLVPEYLQPLYCLILDDLNLLISLLWITSTTMLTGSIEPNPLTDPRWFWLSCWLVIYDLTHHIDWSWTTSDSMLATLYDFNCLSFCVVMNDLNCSGCWLVRKPLNCKVGQSWGLQTLCCQVLDNLNTHSYWLRVTPVSMLSSLVQLQLPWCLVLNDLNCYGGWTRTTLTVIRLVNDLNNHVD